MRRRRRRRSAAPATGGAVADINITPMVDVLLCLLIFTMVIQPGLLKGVDVQVPPPETATAAATAGNRDEIILHVARGPVYTINHQPVTASELETRIGQVFRDRSRKVLFVQGAEDAVYEEVVAAVDKARGAGVRVIGLVPRASPNPEADSTRR